MSEVNYGPPLRFKAVDIETGEVLDNMNADFSYSTENSKILIKDCHYSSDLDPYEAPHSNIKLYQSTGFKDKNGQEVFFGDVVMFGKFAYRVITNPFTQSPGLHTFLNDDPKSEIEGGIHALIENCEIIGNIHTPEAVLSERANSLQ